MSLTIRPYRPSDLNKVLTSWEAASRLAHPFLTEEFYTQERHNIEHLYLPNTETWIAETDEGVIGFIALIIQPETTTEVGGFFVDPKQHGIGAGKALMDKAKAHHGTLELDVFEQNPIGRRFYQRYGFVQISQSIFERTGDPVLRLRLAA